ncbi:MAG: HAD family phosphatase [Clostridia bacterium]|nr:HAD family phosphatase [Clostridia bacterium]
MHITAIAFDMDGTLLDGQSRITPYTERVLQQALAQGIAVIPASGRAPASMRKYLEQLQTGLPYIACNGATLVGADHQILEELTIPNEIAREFVTYMQQQGCYVQTYHGDAFYYACECRHSEDYKHSSGMEGVAVDDLNAFLTFCPPKLLAVDDPEKIARLYPLAIERFKDRMTLTMSAPYFLEALPLGATKGDGLRRLSKWLPIDPETLLTFGDSLNDIAMIEYAAHGVAMDNAREETKRAARYVCLPNTEDGVARFIEQHVLQGVTV